MKYRQAWELVKENISDDEGPHSEGWKWPELLRAIEIVEGAILRLEGLEK